MHKYYIFWVCVCILDLVLRYENLIFPATYYTVICGLSGSTIFFHIISKMARVARRKKEHRMCVFFPHISSTTFLIPVGIQRYSVIKVHVCMWSARYSCLILNKLEFSRRIFEKSSNIKFHEKPSSEGRVVSCGQTDGQTWRSFSQDCAPKSKVRSVAGHDGPEGGQRYSYVPSLTSALNGDGWPAPRTGPLYSHERDPVPIL
jgi:hypothetical protein